MRADGSGDIRLPSTLYQRAQPSMVSEREIFSEFEQANDRNVAFAQGLTGCQAMSPLACSAPDRSTPSRRARVTIHWLARRIDCPRVPAGLGPTWDGLSFDKCRDRLQTHRMRGSVTLGERRPLQAALPTQMGA